MGLVAAFFPSPFHAAKAGVPRSGARTGRNPCFARIYRRGPFSARKEFCMVYRRIVPLLLFLVLLLPAAASGAAIPADFTSLVKTAGPAVVNINTEKLVQQRRIPLPFQEFFKGMPGFNDDMFNQFDQQPQHRTQRSLGSGFLISADGYIVTNHHVVEGADSIKVSFDGEDGKEVSYRAELIGSDQITDLAVLKIEAKNLPHLKLGDSDAMEVGEWVVAIGNPFGLDHTVTAGILSAKGRSIRSNPFDSFLQTDASINPGNSGGPLLNLGGEVIGINAAIIANGQGIGFAIPSNLAKEVINSLRTDRKVSRGWIGVTIQALDENGARALGLPNAKGALVGDVMPENPADKGGMKAGDVILAINGETVADSADLSRKVAAVKPGEKAKFTVWRNGAKKDLTITIAERELETAKAGNADPQTKSLVSNLIGLAARPVTGDDLARLRLPKAEGLLVLKVEPGKQADSARIRAGDVILAVNGQAVATVEELGKILETEGKSRGAVMLQISRQGKRSFAAVEVAKP